MGSPCDCTWILGLPGFRVRKAGAIRRSTGWHTRRAGWRSISSARPTWRPLIVGGQINPLLAARGIRVIPDTHGRTSHLSAADVEAISLYLLSLQK